MTELALTADERLVLHALELIVKIELQGAAGADRLNRKLAQWRAADTRHEQAWCEAMTRWTALSGMGNELRAHFPQVNQDGKNRRISRRRLLAWTLGTVGLASLGSGGSWYLHQPLYARSFRTGHTQTLVVTLPDAAGAATAATSLELNARTGIDVRLFRSRRLVILEQGDVRFSVLHDRSRPFFVQAGAGTVMVRGTTFTVSCRAGALTVAVEEGHVSFYRESSAEKIDPERTLADAELFGGQLLHLRDGTLEVLRQADASAVADWRNGWLNFNDVPLDEALAQINAYRQNPIRLADARAGMQRLTGRFRVASSYDMPRILTEILPLQSRTLPDGEVELRSRS
ncbi:FecR family protein [Herbaspirillum chlorophenolicum]|uniref:FecR family protein n=1 Tax=Herbaspirillum chlorophenolicum TaxID=211589 RepID=A0ABW8EXJ8_9BURK